MKFLLFSFLLFTATWVRGQNDTTLTDKQNKALIGTWVGCKHIESRRNEKEDWIKTTMQCKIVIENGFNFTWTTFDSLNTQTAGTWKVVRTFKKGSDCAFELKLNTQNGVYGYFLLCGPTLNNLFFSVKDPSSADYKEHYRTNFIKAK